MQNKYVLSNKSIQQNNISVFAKCLHLSKQNTQMSLTINQLSEYIKALKIMNDLLCQKTPKSTQILISQLTQQNKILEKSLFRQIKYNQQLSCQLLMKSQLIIQNQSQYKEILQSYEEKIYQLRILLQNKEVVITSIQQQKEQPLKDLLITSKTNLIAFDEIHLLKNLVDRYKLQNKELLIINQLKIQQLAKNKQKLTKIQKILQQNKQCWQTYKKLFQSDDLKIDKTKYKKSDARLNLQEQLTTYDIKYIKHRNESFTKSSIANQINTFKLILINLNIELKKEKQQKVMIKKEMNNKIKEYKILRQKYQKNKKDLYANMIEIQFYRHNFKELNKISKEQKIKYFKDYYNEAIPQFEKEKEKKALITYWKYWHKTSLPKLSYEKCINSKKNILNKPQFRSNSCPLKYFYIKQSHKREITHDKSLAIFSFINQSHNIIDKSLMNPIFDEPQNILLEQKQFDDISLIIKPSRSKDKIQGASEKKIYEEMQIQDNGYL